MPIKGLPHGTTILHGQCRVDPKRKCKFSLGNSTCQHVNPHPCHPPWESSRWFRIPCIRLHLNKSEILPSNSRLRESSHYNQLEWTLTTIICVDNLEIPPIEHTFAPRLQQPQHNHTQPYNHYQTIQSKHIKQMDKHTKTNIPSHPHPPPQIPSIPLECYVVNPLNMTQFFFTWMVFFIPLNDKGNENIVDLGVYTLINNM